MSEKMTQEEIDKLLASLNTGEAFETEGLSTGGATPEDMERSKSLRGALKRYHLSIEIGDRELIDNARLELHYQAHKNWCINKRFGTVQDFKDWKKRHIKYNGYGWVYVK